MVGGKEEGINKGRGRAGWSFNSLLRLDDWEWNICNWLNKISAVKRECGKGRLDKSKCACSFSEEVARKVPPPACLFASKITGKLIWPLNFVSTFVSLVFIPGPCVFFLPCMHVWSFLVISFLLGVGVVIGILRNERLFFNIILIYYLLFFVILFNKSLLSFVLYYVIFVLFIYINSIKYHIL